MSSQTLSPDVPVGEPSTAQLTAAAPALAGTDPAPTGDEFPFESPEFGVGGFFPHLDIDTGTDG